MRKKALLTSSLILLALFLFNQCSSNSLSPEPKSGEALPASTAAQNPQRFDAVPTPIGGDETLAASVSALVAVQNDAALQRDKAKLILSVQVDKNGKVSVLKTVRSLRGLKQETLAAISDIIRETRWQPGTINGAPVQAWRFLEFTFRTSTDGAGGEKRVIAGLAAPAKERGGIFQAYDQAPQPVGGIKAIQANVVFPESARQAGFSGKTIVNLFVDETGAVRETKILKSSGNEECDAAAVTALKKTTWQPAEQNGVPVAVWVGFPVFFQSDIKTASASPKTAGAGNSSSGDPAAYDTPAQPAGGAAALAEALRYPESARKEGFSGITIINILVDENGSVLETKLLKSSGNEECDAAAEDAIRSIEWRSAKKDGKPVRAWVAMPVVFRMN